jgi:hypothetical protein
LRDRDLYRIRGPGSKPERVQWTLALRPGPTRPNGFPRLGCAPPASRA